MSEPPVRPLRAYVDESYTDRRYVMSGVVVDPASNSFRKMMGDLRLLGEQQPDGILHATELNLTAAGQMVLELAERYVVRGSRSVVAVSAPIEPGDRSRDLARQRCLAELAVRLTTGMGVSRLVLDSRDDLDEDRLRRNPVHFRRRNGEDGRTLNGLVNAGEIPALPRGWFEHRDDHSDSGLWLPDITAFAVHRTFATDDPRRLARLASTVQVIAARRLPIAQRDDPDQPFQPDTGLNARLHELRARSLSALVRSTQDPAPGLRDLADRQARAAQIEGRRFAEREGHQPDPLIDYVDPDRGGGFDR